MGKFEMHIHTAENDKFALESAKDIVRLYKQANKNNVRSAGNTKKWFIYTY